MIQAGSLRDIIELLETHRNKQMIRELILENINEIYVSYSDDDLVSFIIELIDLDELGLAKKFYDYIILSDPSSSKSLSAAIINQSNYYSDNIILERIFKIMPSEGLFNFFIEYNRTIRNVNSKLENLYIPFLKTAIKLQKLDLIILIVDFFNKKPFEHPKIYSKITEFLVKEFINCC